MSFKKKMLLLGGGHAEIPLIQAAQNLGWYVITTGNAREGLGHPYADKNVFADFSDKDAMLELAKSESVQAVCSGCNDFALLSTVYVCEKLGLPGHDTYATSLEIHHKDKYRALATRLGIPTPRALVVRSAADFEAAIAQLTFPIIVKPVDLTGGKGIHRAANPEEARIAYKDACSRTRQDHIVVEEFVQGTNHGFSAMLVKGKVAFAFSDNEQYYINKYMVSGANSPSTSSNKTLAMLREYSERIAQELHLVNGILHIQYIERADGTPVIIEICRRPPGDLYIKFVKYATGIDYPKFIVMAETGEDISGIADVSTQGFWLRHCIMAGPEIENGSTVRDVTFAPEIQGNIVEKFLWYKPGEVITDKLTYKAGIVFFKFDSLAEMQDKTARMTELAKITIFQGMKKEPYQIAFIGGGINSAIGEVHKAASQMDGHFELVAGAFSTHAETNQKTARTWGVADERTYADYHELLKAEKGKLDAVVVLAPTDYHKDIVIDALNAGFPVICEKSLATSVAEGEAIAKVVADTKGFFCTTYNYTGYPMVRELKQFIADGKLGKIQQVQVEMPQEGFMRLGTNNEPPKPQSWRLKDTVIPKISLDLGSHLHNMIYFLTGERPEHIVADQTTFGLFPQIVDNVGALVQYTNNVRAQIWFSKTALGNRNGLRIRVYGSEGSAEWFQLEPETLKTCDLRGNVSLRDRTGDVKIANQQRYNRFKAGHPAGFIEAFANYYKDIADCLGQYFATGSFTSQYVCGIHTSLEGLAMMQAAAKSAQSNKWESVQQRF